MRRAFVSHSTAEDSFVGEMEAFLRAAGFDEVFNDIHAIRPNEAFWPVIEKGIANCDALVVVITSASTASEWVKREVEFARSLSKNIIPVWIEDCPVTSTFEGYRTIDWRPRTRHKRPFDISRIVKYAPSELIGREDETKLLADAWKRASRVERGRPCLLTFVALGGEGKTSLVAKWAAELAHQDWPGCDAAFAWSFYSQGTRNQVAASSDLFLKEALTFFGDDADKQFAASNAGAFEKGQRLARIVGQRRSLLILDGLEPLQYAPTSPTPGQLQDQGIAALLKGLASASRGLCVVTTRYSLPDLKMFWQTTAPEENLLRLSLNAGVHLLKTLGVKGTMQEFETLVEDVKGHALTLNLLGSYLRDAHAGDIRRRDLAKLEEADAEEQGGHAFRVMDAYLQWFEHGSETLEDQAKGRRALALLSLLGLFDRPATADCLNALWKGEAIGGLTEPLIGLSKAQRNLSFTQLAAAKLLTVNRDEASRVLIALDAHPLLREYFAKRVRELQPEAWRAAHRRLYEHLCATTEEGDQPTLEDLQPLYQAVAHGCQAGLQQEAHDHVLVKRIRRGDEYYSTKKLGAFGTDLSGITCFFQKPWSRVSGALREIDQGVLLTGVAVRLRALGRLTEALEPMEAGLSNELSREDWENATIRLGNLSELKLVLGDTRGAVATAEQSLMYAERSGDPDRPRLNRTTLGDALHCAGFYAESDARFQEAEALQGKREALHPALYGLAGFRHWELLLAPAERAAWRTTLECRDWGAKVHGATSFPAAPLIEICRAVSRGLLMIAQWRALPDWNPPFDSMIGIAFEHLTLCRSQLFESVLTDFSPALLQNPFATALGALRRAGQVQELPRGLLVGAWLRFLTGAHTGPGSAQEDLDEAWEIAERGPMKLHMADIHLHRARLFFREAKYPWASPAADLAAAEKLINVCGYHRRDEELADAKAAILHGQPPPP